jgi:hypothetical protein
VDWCYKGATKAQALQAAEWYGKTHWMQRDVADALGWGLTKTQKVLRLFAKYGEEVFVDEAEAVRGTVRKSEKPQRARDDLALSARRVQGDGQAVRATVEGAE